MIKENEIGVKAGEIWTLLYFKGALSIRKIGEFTHLREIVLYLSLGWLSKENKIYFFEKDGSTHVGINPVPEVFY